MWLGVNGFRTYAKRVQLVSWQASICGRDAGAIGLKRKAQTADSYREYEQGLQRRDSRQGLARTAD
jgi:hypothetical protein